MYMEGDGSMERKEQGSSVSPEEELVKKGSEARKESRKERKAAKKRARKERKAARKAEKERPIRLWIKENGFSSRESGRRRF